MKPNDIQEHPLIFMRNYKRHLSNLYIKNANEFYYIFKGHLKKFWDSDCGFDIIEFDKFIGTPDNKSLKQHVIDNFGQRAYDLILTLIDIIE